MRASDKHPWSIEQVLNAPLYTLTEASRLVRLTPPRTARWLRGYEYSYKISRGADSRRGSKGPVVQRAGHRNGTYASFLELVDLLLVKRLLDRGISLQKLRKALAEATLLTGQPHFAHEKFFTMGTDLYLKAREFQGSIMKLLSGGQWAIHPIIEELAEKIEFDPATGLANRWFPRGRDYPVVVDPSVSFGRPSLAKRGIATTIIYDLYLGEGENLAAASEWMRIGKEEARVAVEFERQLAA